MARTGGLGGLTVDLLLETVEWIAGLNKAEYQAQQFADAIEKKFKAMGAEVASSLKGMAAGVVAGFTVHALADFINQTQEAADRLDQLAQKAGVSVAFMAELSGVAKMAGTDIEAASKAITKFNQALIEGQAKPGSGPGKVFDALRIALTENGELRKTEDVMRDFNAALAGVEDGAIKTAAAIAVYGRDGALMIPIINAQANASEELKKALHDQGAEMERLKVYSAAWQEQLGISNAHTKELGALLGEQLLPYFTKLLEQWNQLTGSGHGLSQVVQVLVNAFKVLLVVLDASITGVVLLIKGLYDSARVLVLFLSGNWKEAAEAGAAVWSDMGAQLGAFTERTKALLLSMPAVTAQVVQQKKPTDDLARAVAKLADEKERLHKINMADFPLMRVHEVDDRVTMDNTSIEQLLKPTRDLIKAQEEEQKKYLSWLKDEYGGLYSNIEKLGMDAFGALFGEVEGGWKGLLTTMAKDFKKLLMDLVYQQVAKPLILNLVASIAPGGLGQYASSMLGGSGGSMDWGSMVKGGQSAYDWFTGPAGGTSENAQLMRDFGGVSTEGATYNFFGGGGGTMGGAGYGIVGGVAGYGAASLYGAGDRGKANAASYGAIGAQVGSAFGPWGAAAGWAIGTIAGIATDPDPDAMRKGTFGTTKGAKGLTKYNYTSKLGSFGISDTEWFSDSDQGEQLKAFMAAMQNLDNAIASSLDDTQLAHLKNRLEEFSKQYEFGMEHTDSGGGLTDIVKDRLRIVTEEIAPELKKFFDAFTGPVEELVQVVEGYVAMRAALQDFDPEKMVEEIYKENDARADQMGMYQTQRAELEQLVEDFDGSAASTNELTNSLFAFQQATVVMIMQIDAASDAMHKMFTDTANAIRMDVMSPEEKYKFLQERSSATMDQLMGETDPSKIANLADKINKDINSAWALLSDDQKSALKDEYLSRLATLDQTVADKMAGLRDVVIEDAADTGKTLGEKLDEVFGKATEAADKNLDAANKNVTAANTPVNVVVTTRPDGSIVSEAG